MKRSQATSTDRYFSQDISRQGAAGLDSVHRTASRTVGLLAVATAAIIALTWPLDSAKAQWAACAERAAVVERLKVGYQESEAGYGVTGSGLVAELFVSETGSWTIVITRPDGVSCLVAAGQSWETQPVAPRTVTKGPAS